MSNNGRIFFYLAALILFLVAAILDAVEARKVTTLSLMGVGLAAITFVPLWDAVQAT